MTDYLGIHGKRALVTGGTSEFDTARDYAVHGAMLAATRAVRHQISVANVSV